MHISHFQLLPQELISLTFSYLDINALDKCTKVQRQWHSVINNSDLWKLMIYKELAFSNQKWVHFFGEQVIKKENDFSSLEPTIVEEYRNFKKMYPKKNIKKYLVLVQKPKLLNRELNLETFSSLVKKAFPKNPNGFSYIWEPAFEKLKNKSEEENWMLMTRHILPKSRGNNLKKDQSLLSNLDLKSYKIPSTLEASICMLSQYIISKSRILSDKPHTYTKCCDLVENKPVIVGNFSNKGWQIRGLNTNNKDIGIGVVKNCTTK